MGKSANSECTEPGGSSVGNDIGEVSVLGIVVKCNDEIVVWMRKRFHDESAENSSILLQHLTSGMSPDNGTIPTCCNTSVVGSFEYYIDDVPIYSNTCESFYVFQCALEHYATPPILPLECHCNTLFQTPFPTWLTLYYHCNIYRHIYKLRLRTPHFLFFGVTTRI